MPATDGHATVGSLDRVLLHLRNQRRLAMDPAAVYFLEAVADDTLVRTRGAQRLRDVRSLGKLLEVFQAHGFFRVHRNHAVNLRQIREIRPREKGQDWELRLQPPVNRVLPISRDHLPALLAAFGDTAP